MPDNSCCRSLRQPEVWRTLCKADVSGNAPMGVCKEPQAVGAGSGGAGQPWIHLFLCQGPEPQNPAMEVSEPFILISLEKAGHPSPPTLCLLLPFAQLRGKIKAQGLVALRAQACPHTWEAPCLLLMFLQLAESLTLSP